MDVADAACKEVNAEISDQLALFGIRALALADDAVFFAADAADFRLDGHAFLMRQSYQLFGLLDVLVDREVGAVEHDAGESGIDALEAAFV